MCRNILQMDDTSSVDGRIDAQVDYKALLRCATSATVAKNVIYGGLRDKLSKVLSIPIADIADIDGHSSITSYGTESLVAVDLRNWLSKEMGVDVAIFEILSNKGLGDFSEMAAWKSSFVTFADDKGTWTVDEDEKHERFRGIAPVRPFGFWCSIFMMDHVSMLSRDYGRSVCLTIITSLYSRISEPESR